MAATPSVIDFEALIAPIPGDNPAGESVAFDVKEKLEEFRKEENPDDFTADDPMRPEQFKKADWPTIIRLAQETLTNASKDLLTVARLTEALVKKHGYAGLRDGLHLMRMLVEQCWDRLNPVIETEDDIELRAGPFNWLDDPDRGARFPNTLRSTPVAALDGVPYSWMDWKISQEGKGSVTRADFDKAIQGTPTERCSTQMADIDQASEELTQLVHALSEKMASAAPGLTALRQAVDDCRMLMHQIMKIKGPVAGDSEEGSASAGGDGASSTGPARAAGTRAEAYRQLAQAAALLEQLEPHSPVPFLVRRAVEMGSLSFPLLIKLLIREPNVLAELSRELGIKDGDAAKPG